MDKSPYLSAVQSLSGECPGDKYKELHLIAAQIMDNAAEREEFVKTGASKRVQPALLPYLRVVVGVKFEIGEFVVEALKSDDVTIVKQALGARWFYGGSSPLAEVQHFVEEVVPRVSMRTRLELMKTLAHCLMEDPRKAERLFDSFADQYGVEQTLPLMVACGEEYIFEAVLRRRIVLPKRILTALYKRYPDLVVRYLRLGNEGCPANEAERKRHRISLANYGSFLPKLVKLHTGVFIELYECLARHQQSAKLGSTRAEFFLKNAMDVLIQRPRTFLDVLPLKLVSNKLTTQQFDAMFQNLLDEDVRNFRINDVMKYLQYYPQEKKLDLLLNSYRNRYGEDLLDDAEAIFSAKEFSKLLPTELKEERARKYVESYEGKPEYIERVRLLPPSESLPILKEKISKTTDLENRSRYIEYMIISCSLYNSKEDLLKVLEYYNTRHKNEQPVVLQQVLGSLVQRFDIAKLDKAHWQILKEIIQRSYIKGDLNDAPTYTYVPLFSGALRYCVKRCQEVNEQEDSMFLDRLVRIITELFFERNMKWDFVIESPDVGRDCLCKFLEIIPKMYAADDSMWNKNDNKLSLATYLIRAMEVLNANNETRKRKRKKTTATTSDSKEGRPKRTRFAIRDYPWLKVLVYDLLKLSKILDSSNKNTGQRRLTLLRFAKMVRQHDAELYQSLIDADPELTNDVESEDALLLLKYDHKKVLDKWKQYLKVCRQSVQFTRRSTQRFIISTKWYQELPILFIQDCAAQLNAKEDAIQLDDKKDATKIDVKGSALILGLLLEGEAMAKLISSYLPKESRIDVESDDAKRLFEITKSLPKAMNLANPPISFDVLTLFCQGDYISTALQSLTNAALRIPLPKVIAFIKLDFKNKPITVKKQLIRLLFRVAPGNESRDFLQHLWNEEHNHSVREVLAKMILDSFKKSPNQDSWALLKVCIEGLTPDDSNVFTSLVKRMTEIDCSYVSLYLEEFIKKIDSFTNEQLEENSRLEYFQSIVSYIDSKLMQHLSDELVKIIVKRYPLNYNASFMIGVFILSDEKKFEVRLQTLFDILLQELQQFDVPDPEVPRYCPKNREVREFFIDLVRYVYREYKDECSILHRRLVSHMLSLFSKILRPWKEPRSFIALCLCNDWLEINRSPKLFGERCVDTAKRLVEVCASELILTQVADVLTKEVLSNESFHGDLIKEECKLIVIESMMSKDPRIGALLGIKILSHFEASKYDDRFDKFMETWKAMDDPMVQSTLSEFVNTSNRMYYGAKRPSPLALSSNWLSLH